MGARKGALMPVNRPLLIAACFAGSLLTAGCTGGKTDANPLAPGDLIASSKAVAPLTVQVDRVCEGQESQIRVFVDLEAIGVTNPGEAGVFRMVTVGEHKLT